MEKNVMIIASVASMIDQFTMPNIDLLLEMGYKVHVACNFEKGNNMSSERVEDLKLRLSIKKIEFYQVDFDRNALKINMHCKAYKQVNNILKKYNFEFLHCHSPIGGAIGRIAGKRNKVKVIYTAHGFHFFKGAPIKNWALYYPVEKILSRYTDVLVTINSEDFGIAKRKFLSHSVKLVNGIGIDTSNIKEQTTELKSTFRKKYNFSEDDFILFYAAELNNNKNQGLLIEGMNLLKNRIPNIKLLLAGTGNLRDYYGEMVRKFELEDIVIFLGYREDVLDLLLLSDVAVASSKREGLPVNLLEAMATGLPIVATDSRGQRELVTDGINGFLIEDSSTQFAEKINIIYQNNEILKSFGENNRRDVKKYSTNNVLEELRRIYLDLVVTK